LLAVSRDSSLTNALLVAMPQLQDPNFRRSVMLIIEHDDNGAFGLVLNRDVELLASTLCASLDIHWHGDPEAYIRWGGPVEPSTGWLLFNEPLTVDVEDPAITNVGDGIFLARSVDVLRSVASTPPHDIRFYLGYAGWGPGQLEGEMAEGAWIVAPSDPDIVFGVDPESMWDHVVRGLGIDPATLIPTQGVH
jgi:putative transcriptional regulator